MLHGLELLKQGVIWRIGTGSQVCIWHDPWIPRGVSHRVVTRPGRCRLRWVSDLLDTIGRDWDFDRLAHIFCLADIEAIAKIKLPSRPFDDFLAWSGEKSGLFTVRSAYNLALKLKNLQNLQSSSSALNGERKLWSHIWKGGVPPKVNVFAWKLSRNALPTKRNKFIRGMEVNGICPICDREDESSYHATVAYPAARGLRSAMREYWLLPDEEQFFSGPDWLLLLLNNCSAHQ